MQPVAAQDTIRTPLQFLLSMQRLGHLLLRLLQQRGLV
jgi:hypothetical protein